MPPGGQFNNPKDHARSSSDRLPEVLQPSFGTFYYVRHALASRGNGHNGHSGNHHRTFKTQGETGLPTESCLGRDGVGLVQPHVVGYPNVCLTNRVKGWILFQCFCSLRYIFTFPWLKRSNHSRRDMQAACMTAFKIQHRVAVQLLAARPSRPMACSLDRIKSPLARN